MTDAIHHITVGVARMEPVEELWVRRFGLEIVDRRSGSDPCLGRLWDINPDVIAEQLYLTTPGASHGRLHFVRFDPPGLPVREGAASTDLGPKNLDVNCVDMPARVAELKSDGQQFRSHVGEYQVDDLHARETQMPGHDDTNIVLIEVLSAGWDAPLSNLGYGAVTSLVVVVSDPEAEADFYSALLGLDQVMHHRLTGPAIEETVGLPPGSALDFRLMGKDTEVMGRMELVHYEGLAGTNRFALAGPPALGTLHAAYTVDSIQAVNDRAAALGLHLQRFGCLDTIFGKVEMASTYTPAGLRIDLLART